MSEPVPENMVINQSQPKDRHKPNTAPSLSGLLGLVSYCVQGVRPGDGSVMGEGRWNFIG
jgi:hypothetical protein